MVYAVACNGSDVTYASMSTIAIHLRGQTASINNGVL